MIFKFNQILLIVFIFSIDIFANIVVVPNTLSDEIKKLSKEIDNIYIRYEKYQMINKKFETIAQTHYELIKSINDSEKICNTLKLKFYDMNVSSDIVKKYQLQSLERCYKRYKYRIQKFDMIDKNFTNLEKQMQILHELNESEKELYKSLNVELNIQRKMLKSFKIQANNKINETIDENYK